MYEKVDNVDRRTSRLRIRHTVFVERQVTADYQTTQGLLEILDRDGNEDDAAAFLLDRRLPLDEVGAQQLAGEVLGRRPLPGFLTMSNALQWRLQFRRVLDIVDSGQGVYRLTPRERR